MQQDIAGNTREIPRYNTESLQGKHEKRGAASKVGFYDMPCYSGKSIFDGNAQAKSACRDAADAVGGYMTNLEFLAYSGRHPVPLIDSYYNKDKIVITLAKNSLMS